MIEAVDGPMMTINESLITYLALNCTHDTKYDMMRYSVGSFYAQSTTASMNSRIFRSPTCKYLSDMIVF